METVQGGVPPYGVKKKPGGNGNGNGQNHGDIIASLL